MAVKVFIERHVRHGNEPQIIALLKELRSHCLNQPGYIQGETLRDSGDPSQLLVISQWFGLGHWREWERSAQREEIESQIRPLLERAPVIRVYLEGLSEEISGA